ncbi:serine/threonine kinase (plasmid) [Leptolyngbya boryana IAM M-101]|nr:serine/threonine kinase [Leptolyngbya boryana IAM M-101]BAS66460.1 serine/threonine kinase [Leptolyngbya boryana dg5]
METIYANMLQQAESLASRDRFAQALQKVQGIPRNSRHFFQAQQFQESWSKEVLQQALEQYRQGSLDQALVSLKPIPSSASITSQVKAFRTAWTQEARFLNQALSAAANRDWSNTLRSLESLRGTGTYTTPRVQTLLEQAIANAFDPSATTIRLATTPVIQSVPFTLSIPPLTQFTPPKLTPLAVNTEKAIAQSEPHTAATTVATNSSAAPNRTAPVPVTPLLPVPSPPPAPSTVARSEATQTPVAIPQAITTSPQTQSSSTALTPPPTVSGERTSGEIAQSELLQREQTATPQALQPSRELTVPSQSPAQPQGEPSQAERNEVQSPQQTLQTETASPQPPSVPRSPIEIKNQAPQIETPPPEPLNADLVAEFSSAERILMLKPLDTQTLQKVTDVVQANAGTPKSSQPVESNAAVSTR